MDHTLAYLRESLSNWTEDHPAADAIYQKLDSFVGLDEATFAKALSQEDLYYLNEIVRKEMSYAKSEGDNVRYHQLNEVYEQLY